MKKRIFVFVLTCLFILGGSIGCASNSIVTPAGVLELEIQEGNKVESIKTLSSEQLENTLESVLQLEGDFYGWTEQQTADAVANTYLATNQQLYEISQEVDQPIPMTFEQIANSLHGKTYAAETGMVIALNEESYKYRLEVLIYPSNRAGNSDLPINVIDSVADTWGHEIHHYVAGEHELENPTTFTAPSGNVFTYYVYYGFDLGGVRNSNPEDIVSSFGNLDEIAVEILHLEAMNQVEINRPMRRQETLRLYEGVLKYFFQRVGVSNLQELDDLHKSFAPSLVVIEYMQQQYGLTPDEAFARMTYVSNILQSGQDVDIILSGIDDIMTFE